jgi:hypothetical protein
MKIALKALSLTISGIGMVGLAQAGCPIPNALMDLRGGAIDVSGTYEASSGAMRAVLGNPENCGLKIRASGQQTHTKSQLVSPLRDDLTSMAFQVGFATSALQSTRPAELTGNLSFAMLDIERLGSQGAPNYQLHLRNDTSSAGLINVFKTQLDGFGNIVSEDWIAGFTVSVNSNISTGSPNYAIMDLMWEANVCSTGWGLPPSRSRACGSVLKARSNIQNAYVQVASFSALYAPSSFTMGSLGDVFVSTARTSELGVVYSMKCTNLVQPNSSYAETDKCFVPATTASSPAVRQ